MAITRSPTEFHKYFNDEEIEVLDAVHLTPHLDRIVYRRRQEFERPPTTNSVPIAVFVTAYARRRLYDKFTEAVANGANLIYADTDSIMIQRNKNRPAIKEGISRV